MVTGNLWIPIAGLAAVVRGMSDMALAISLRGPTAEAAPAPQAEFGT